VVRPSPPLKEQPGNIRKIVWNAASMPVFAGLAGAAAESARDIVF
jgi:hypothetical protein